MKINFLTILILLICLNSFGQEQFKISQDSLYHKDNGENIYIKSQVDSIPKYNETEMYLHVAKNLSYPPDARENGIQGKVYSSFVVEKDGSISDIIIIKGLTESCDKEVKRLISTLPNKWTPALKNGQPVRFQFILPVSFKVTDEKIKKRK